MAKEYKPTEFRLTGDIAPLSFIIQTGQKGDLLVFDEDSGFNKPIRHCRNEQSIFIEDQSAHAKVDPIIFYKGYLKLEATETLTKKFLEAHPSNVLNGGKLFEIVDDEKKAEDALELQEIILQLKLEVMNKSKEKDGIHELKALASVIQNSYVKVDKLSSPEVRQIVYAAIDANPRVFLDNNNKPKLFDPDINRKYIALKAIGQGVVLVSTDGRSLLWSSNNNVITSVPSGIKPTDHFAEYLATDEGALVIERIIKNI